MKKALALAIFALCAAPMFASVALDTSINDVFNRGSSELAGSITWNVTGDDFRDASTEEPIFIRVTPDHNSFLAETLVRQTSSNPENSLPINLAMRLDGGGVVVDMVALPECTSIVRWVAGESSLWIRVQQSSDQWLTVGAAPTTPSVSNEVSWTIGITARRSDVANTQGSATNASNLPFNTRYPEANEGDFEEATSTLICVDLSSSNLAADGRDDSLLNYDIIAYDFQADLGNGVYSGQQGNDTGINFTNDFTIARGKDRACLVESIIPDKSSLGVALLCIFRAASNSSTEEFVKLQNTLVIDIDCEAGGNFLGTELVPGAFLTFDTQGNGSYGFWSTRKGVFFTTDVPFLDEDEYELINAMGTRFYDDIDGDDDDGGVFTVEDEDFYEEAILQYDSALGEDNVIPLSGGRALAVTVCVWQHYTEDPITATVDWDLYLVSHEDTFDEEPYLDASDDFADQNRRCSPSVFYLGGETFTIGDFVDCSGVPVSIFFPYLPTLVGNGDFWVGLSYVNQGATDLDIQTVFYDEDGNRFAGEMGDLVSRGQKTWLLAEGANGIASMTGVGANNAGEEVIPEASDPNMSSADFGTSRMSLFVRGTFGAEFLDDVYSGDLDGYLLVGNLATFSIDGAYLPRNYDNDVPGQNADLPLWRSKASSGELSGKRYINIDAAPRFEGRK